MGYKVGGSLSPNDPTYVEREADDRLYQLLIQREFCYVLNARQMGKSSLIFRTIQRLETAGILAISLDLSDLGQHQMSLEQWYGGLAFKLTTALHLFDIQTFLDWWQRHHDLAPVQRLGELMQRVILPQSDRPLVLFLDEIDSVLSFPGCLDDFFAWIRSCYNRRADDHTYDRLTIVLLGVATPNDLIQDPQRTPFNIGKAIDLQPFTLREAQPLALGLPVEPDLAQTLLATILLWSGGQPFLTQKLCDLVAHHLTQDNNSLTTSPDRFVQTIVQTRLLRHWETQDEPTHLRTIRDRLLANPEDLGRLLGLYDRIMQRGTLPIDSSLDQAHLKLSGLVRQEAGYLQVYNPIYQQIFSPAWIQDVLQRLRPYAPSLDAWLRSGNQDESRLLRGQALVDALAWAMDKHLSPDDYQFLAASRDLALADSQAREAQSRLEIERLQREKDLLEQLTTAQEQQRQVQANLTQQRWRWKLSLAGAITSMLAFLLGVGWMSTTTQATTLRLTRLVQLADTLLETQPLDPQAQTLALAYSLEAGRLLRDSLGVNSSLKARLGLTLARSTQAFRTGHAAPVTAPDPNLIAPDHGSRVWAQLVQDQRVWLGLIFPDGHGYQGSWDQGFSPLTVPQPLALQWVRSTANQAQPQLLSLDRLGQGQRWLGSTPTPLFALPKSLTPLKSAQWNPQGDRLLIRTQDDRAYLLQGQTGAILLTLGEQVAGLTWGPNPQHFSLITHTGQWQSWQQSWFRSQFSQRSSLALGLDFHATSPTLLQALPAPPGHALAIGLPHTQAVTLWDAQQGLQGYLPQVQPLQDLVWWNGLDGEPVLVTLTSHPNTAQARLTLWGQDFRPLGELRVSGGAQKIHLHLDPIEGWELALWVAQEDGKPWFLSAILGLDFPRNLWEGCQTMKSQLDTYNDRSSPKSPVPPTLQRSLQPFCQNLPEPT